MERAGEKEREGGRMAGEKMGSRWIDLKAVIRRLLVQAASSKTIGR